MIVVSVDYSTAQRDLDLIRSRLGDSGHIRRAMGDVLDEGARIGEESAERYVPKRTRGAQRAIDSDPASRTATDALQARVVLRPVEGVRSGTANYPALVHEGTGLFGPRHQEIRSPTGGLMRFRGRGGGWISRYSIRGQRPQPFMAEAFDDTAVYISQRIDTMVDRILGER